MSDTRTEHTPGPWGWFGNANSNSLYLATKHSGRRYVMGFKRWGFSGGQPEFQPAGRGMVDASELLQFEVGDRDVVGVKVARENTSVYRMDIRGIDCADARLIAAAPDFIEAAPDAADLLEQYAAFILTVKPDDLELHPYQPAVEQAASALRAAIAKARGESL
ncbi:hypothetical protein [Novosphingobium sp. ZW T3_23]|uniref:hypothetical protein n=1 Tax=Novosphingobium sp. ZW T3_23 TaxID=3378084 RepID=UPI0038531959